MKTKNKMTKRGIIFLFILMLIPFAMSYDIDGDGIDDGEQVMCGDTFCQPGETITSCPADCTNPATPPSGNLTNITTENETLSPETNQTILTTEENLETETEESFFSTTAFKIIILVLGLIAIGLIIFLIIRKNKNHEEENQTQTAEVSAPETLS